MTVRLAALGLLAAQTLLAAACAPAALDSLPPQTPAPIAATATPFPTAAPPTVPPATPTTPPSPRPPAATVAPATATPRPTQAAVTLDERVRRVETGFIGADGQAATLAERMAHYKVPGVSIAVINNYQIEWAKGYGVKAVGASDPVTPDTLFQAASISKPVTAYGLLRLVDAGKLGLDDNVNDYLKTWKLPDNDFTRDNPVTLRRILSHTAGLTVSGYRGYAQGEAVPSLLHILDGQPPANNQAIRVDTPPGRRYRYSGGGYTLLQQLVADVSGQDFATAMQRAVLEPLGMTRSAYAQPLPDDRAADAALGHLANGLMVRGGWHTHPELGPAGLWATPSDLARFAIEVQRTASGQGARGLSAPLVKEMLMPQIEDPDRGVWGLGPQLIEAGGSRWFSHGGGNVGYRCRLLANATTGQGVVIMTNADSGGELMHEILASLGKAYDWAGFR